MWDYFKLNGSRWNHKTSLDEQLEILNKYYPIGNYYHYIPDQYTTLTQNKEIYCKLLGYVLNEGHQNSWYILRVENIDIAVGVTGIVYDTRHPGFFYPAVEINRKYKLNNLLDV